MSNKHKRNGYQPGATYRQPGIPEGATVTVAGYTTVPASDAAETKVLPRAPYKAEEKTFTTRPGGPSVADLMSDYINAFATETGAALLNVHPIPANNSFLFVWEL
jgi:hypothetical protein